MKKAIPYLAVIILPIIFAGMISNKSNLILDEGNSSLDAIKEGYGRKIGVVKDTTTFFIIPPKILKTAIQLDTISFSGYENIEIDKVDFLTYNYSDYYLFAEGSFRSHTGSEILNFTIAYELLFEANGLYNMGDKQSVNKCAGNGCSSCEFDTNSSGQIIGCKCNSGSGICDHTIIALDAVGSGYSLLNISEAYNYLANQ